MTEKIFHRFCYVKSAESARSHNAANAASVFSLFLNILSMMSCACSSEGRLFYIRGLNGEAVIAVIHSDMSNSQSTRVGMQSYNGKSILPADILSHLMSTLIYGYHEPMMRNHNK